MFECYFAGRPFPIIGLIILAFMIGCFVGAAIYKFLTEYPKKKK